MFCIVILNERSFNRLGHADWLVEEGDGAPSSSNFMLYDQHGALILELLSHAIATDSHSGKRKLIGFVRYKVFLKKERDDNDGL